jgi:hypothetical protein
VGERLLTKKLEEFLAKSEQPVLFAGAGVSVKAGMPDWTGYLSELAAAAATFDPFTKYQMDDAIKEGALEVAASYYQICRKIPEATRLLDLVAPLTTYDSKKIEPLAKLPFASIATTNFDRALFDAYAGANGRAAREVNLDDPTMKGAAFATEFYIARIHGRVEVPSSMRLSEGDMVGLGINVDYQNFLAHLFTRRQVLFIGFSFLDPAIKAVLAAVTARFGSFHGNEHVALVPKGDTSSLGTQLAKHSIKIVGYDAAQGHAELWGAIAALASKGSSVPLADGHRDAREQPFRIAKKYLATAYARIRVGGQSGPLGKAVIEGVVSGMLRAAPSVGLTEADLVRDIGRELALDQQTSATLVSQSLFALGRDKIVQLVPGAAEARYVSKEANTGSYQSAIDRLVDGVVNRHLIREKSKDSVALRNFLERVFVALVLRRGWDLGAAFAARKVPEDIDVFSVLESVNEGRFSNNALGSIASSVEDLLTRPDDTEAFLLAELGKLGFGLELLIESPHDALFIQRTIPERIYIDANVLMPAITPGHPHSEIFNQTITALQESANKAVANVAICVYEGFLNEIVSHRQLAIEIMRERNGEGALWAEREVGLLGSAGVNVYVGAYFNIRAGRTNLQFEEFLREFVPYTNEAQLRKYLLGRGFEIVAGGAKRKDLPAILHVLEKHYATRLEYRTKSAVVVGHDAQQLAILNYDLSVGRRAILVSADRSLRAALQQGEYSSLTNGIVSHLGLAQLVELLVGGVGASRGLSSLLWMSEVSGETERVRNHLINLALKEHDAALTMTINEVVDAIAEDAADELASRGLSVGTERKEQRVDVNQILERYEADFFRKMKEAMDRQKR